MTTKTYTDSDGIRFTVTAEQDGHTWIVTPETPIGGAYYTSVSLQATTARGRAGIKVTLLPEGIWYLMDNVDQALRLAAEQLRRVPGDPADLRDSIRAWMLTPATPASP